MAHLLPDPPPREVEGVGILVSSKPPLSWPDRLSVCTRECGCRCFWLVPTPLASPWSCPISTAERETDREPPGCKLSAPIPALMSPSSLPTTIAGSDCKDKAERLDLSPPMLTSRLFDLSKIGSSLSFAFFRNLEKDCRRLIFS